MFYHLEILKKTGPFYPLWLADTYPRRFLRIPENKIWSYNVAEICDNLIEIIKAETMNPGKRFSLRLSARLTYGVLKLFERQRQMFLHSVFSLNMAITKRRAVEVEKPKRKHKKSTSEEQPVLPQEQGVPQVEECLIPEADVIKMLNSSQQVQNTEITLRENALVTVENKMDNFGEEGDPVSMFLQENVLRDGRIGDSILEQSAEHRQNIVVVAEVHRADDPALPEISMKDVSYLAKTLNPIDEIVIEASKTIEISKFNETTATNLENEIVPEIQVTSVAPDLQNVPLVIENENIQERRAEKRPYNSISLDETPVLDPNVTLPVPRRRRRIIKDTTVILHHEYMKARIQNPNVEMRCQHALLDAVNIEAAISEYRFLLPHAAFERRSLIQKMERLSKELRSAYGRNLITKTVPNERSAFKRLRQIEEIRADIVNETSRNMTLNVPMAHTEDQHTTLLPNASINTNMSIIVPSPTHHGSMLNAPDKSILPDITIPDIEISKDTTVEKSTSRSQKQRDKPVSILTTTMDDIRQDISKSVSFNVSDKRTKSSAAKKIETNKENIHQHNIPPPPETIETNNLPAEVHQMQMEITKEIPMEIETLREDISAEKSQINGTMLGSLDRTDVSLGDNSMTAEEKNVKEYLEKEWGNMGMWEKIISAKQARCYPLNVEVIVKRAQIPSYISKRRVAVNAFKAILLMRKYRFIKIEKHPETLTILNIRRGDAVKDLRKK